MKKDRYVEYDILRVILVILVLIGHSTYYYIDTKYGGIKYALTEINVFKILRNITFYISIFHMPLFFALSGALFANSNLGEKKKNFKELANNKFKRLIIPFIFATLFWVVPLKYFTGYYSESTNVLKDIFVGQFLCQGNAHLWFLPTLFFIFLIIYPLEKKHINRALLVAFFIFLNIISFNCTIVIFKSVLTNIIYFYLGYIFHIHREKINKIIVKYKFLVIPEIILWFLIVKMSIVSVLVKYTQSITILMGVVLSQKIIMAVLGSVIVYSIVYLIKDKLKNSKFIQKVNECSLGIYLYSDPLNYLILFLYYNLYDLKFVYIDIGVLNLFVLRFFITFGVSYAITRALKKLKVKYIC